VAVLESRAGRPQFRDVRSGLACPGVCDCAQCRELCCAFVTRFLFVAIETDVAADLRLGSFRLALLHCGGLWPCACSA